MRIIVSDSSALIDLKKGDLLEIFLRLPFEFVIPDVLLDSELLSFSKSELAMLRRNMTVAELNGPGIERAKAALAEMPALSIPDSIAFVVAQDRPGSILLTGDRRLRQKSSATGIECHGILWIVEQIRAAKLTTPKHLIRTLESWLDDFLVRLPRPEVEALIARLQK